MVNFLFLVDTSYVMNTKVSEYGLTLLDLCKTAIHRSVNNRRKSISKPTDCLNNNTKFNHKYLLVTHSSSSAVKCGWENATDFFLKAIEALQANDAPNFGSALSAAFRLFESNPNQILSYGQGWKSWQNEMNVMMILTYCIDSSSSVGNKRNEILKLSARTLYGDELQSDYIRWNTRIFVGNINVFGTLQIDTQTNSIRDALNSLCCETSPTDAVHVVNNELHSLGQIERWVSAIMRDNSRDGIMVEFWDSSKEEGDATNDALIKFNAGELFREFLVPTHCDCKWPIPESYSPKEHHHQLPPRRCRPQIAISRAQKGAACLPRSEWNVPYEQYEISSPRLRDFLINLPHTICYYAYIQYSAGAKFNYAKPWGTLKGDSKRNKAFLYVFVYDFPFVWNQISVFLQAKKRNFHNFSADEWKRAVGAYLNFIPSYYVQSVRDLLMQTTKGVHLPPFPSTSALEPSLVSFINEVQRKWRGNAHYKAIAINKYDDDDDDDAYDDDECPLSLNLFPFEEEEQGNEEKLDRNNDGEHELCELELPFVANKRKRKSVYSEEKRKRRKLWRHKQSDTDSQLLSHCATKKEIEEMMNHLSLCVFGDDIAQRTDSFDASSAADAQRKLIANNGYKLILDQKEDDTQHIEKHHAMGNYTMYAEKLRFKKKEEFRNPFQTESEYSNYAMSLSFIFLQQNNEKKKKSESFLETERKLKCDKLLSIEQVLAIKARTNEAIWTKNELSTRFYDDDDDDEDDKLSIEYRHSLLKSADWLSSQVLHNLKPTNLGGNPFKKRRRKSAFPTIIKPARNNEEKEKEKEVEQKEEELVKQKERKVSEKEQEAAKISAPLPAPAPAAAAKAKKNQVNASKKVVKKAKVIKTKVVDINRAIESAKRKQKILQRKTQILPMKRRTNSTSSTSSSSSSSSPSATIEPAAKKQKLSNGANGVKTIQIVNNHNHHHLRNGHQKQESTQSQTTYIVSFMQKYREMVRSPNTFDIVWFHNGLSCVNGLDTDSKNQLAQILINEAITYNRYKLAQNIRDLLC